MAMIYISVRFRPPGPQSTYCKFLLETERNFKWEDIYVNIFSIPEWKDIGCEHTGESTGKSYQARYLMPSTRKVSLRVDLHKPDSVDPKVTLRVPYKDGIEVMRSNWLHIDFDRIGHPPLMVEYIKGLSQSDQLDVTALANLLRDHASRGELVDIEIRPETSAMSPPKITRELLSTLGRFKVRQIGDILYVTHPDMVRFSRFGK